MADNPFVTVEAPSYAAPLVNFFGNSKQAPQPQQQPQQQQAPWAQALQSLLQPKSQASGPSGAGGNPSETEAYIRSAAKARGIDPDQAVRVARSEGLTSYTGDSGSSFGPFQLHYGGVAPGGNSVGGLGDTFTKQTGLNARDPSTVKQQIDFALDYASKNGWSPWHGWKGDPYAGIGRGNVDSGLY